MVKILTMEKRELLLPSKKKKNQSQLDERNWERQTTKPIAYNFDVLFNDGKKIACLQNGFKFAALSFRKILLIIMTSFYENVC